MAGRLLLFGRGARSMTIRKKILLFSALALGAFLTAVSLVSRIALLKAFARLEADSARENVSRMHGAVASERSKLAILAIAYGQWDQTYKFMAGQDPAFADSEFSPAALKRIHVDCIALFDPADKLVLYRGIRDWSAIPADVHEIASAHEQVVSKSGKNVASSGILDLDGRLLMLSFQPIVPTQGTDTSRGTLVMAREWDNSVISSISHNMGTPAWLEPGEGAPHASADLIWSNGEDLARTDGDSSMLDYVALHDFSGATRGFLVTRTPRALYLEGKIKIHYLWTLLLLTGTIFCAGLLFFVDAILVRRIRSLSQEVSRITVSGDLGLRLNAGGSDELSGLAGTVNTMLIAIQKAKSELEHAQESLRFHAEHDALTGILNRRAIRDVLRKELARCRRDKSTLGVILGDLDHFKRINDRFGHGAGDTLLVTAVQRIAANLRSYDSFGRYGGEEFLLIAPGCDLAVTQKLAERIRIAIGGEPVDLGVESAKVTISLGVTLGTADSDPEFLVAVADRALYQAKGNGRNRVEIGLELPEEDAVEAR